MRFILLFVICSMSSIAVADLKGRIVTDVGTIGIKLYSDNMPETAINFASLAMGRKKYFSMDGKRVQKPFYNGLTVHRAHPDLGIFSGCPLGNGRGWPGFMIPLEKVNESKFTRPGLLAMAKIPGDNRVGSQFFITTKATPRLNGKYPVFGEVTSGMDIVEKIAKVNRDVTMKPLKPILIKEIHIDDF